MFLIHSCTEIIITIFLYMQALVSMVMKLRLS
jgi:hypothetical protein